MLFQGTSAGQVLSVDDVKIKGDEFWDYDQQVDLEAFSTKDFFSTLSKQSSDVTSALARQKDQVRPGPFLQWGAGGCHTP